jgi:hypothetical protein
MSRNEDRLERLSRKRKRAREAMILAKEIELEQALSDPSVAIKCRDGVWRQAGNVEVDDTFEEED